MTGRPEARTGDATTDEAAGGPSAASDPGGQARNGCGPDSRVAHDDEAETERARTEIEAGDLGDDLADFA